jgi:hypothetical protein
MLQFGINSCNCEIVELLCKTSWVGDRSTARNLHVQDKRDSEKLKIYPLPECYSISPYQYLSGRSQCAFMDLTLVEEMKIENAQILLNKNYKDTSQDFYVLLNLHLSTMPVND